MYQTNTDMIMCKRCVKEWLLLLLYSAVVKVGSSVSSSWLFDSDCG